MSASMQQEICGLVLPPGEERRVLYASPHQMIATYAMSLEDLERVYNSFFSIWSTARVTEVYQLGTKWALQVQFGMTKVQEKDKHVEKYHMMTTINGGSKDSTRRLNKSKRSQFESPTQRGELKKRGVGDGTSEKSWLIEDHV